MRQGYTMFLSTVRTGTSLQNQGVQLEHKTKKLARHPGFEAHSVFVNKRVLPDCIDVDSGKSLCCFTIPHKGSFSMPQLSMWTLVN